MKYPLIALAFLSASSAMAMGSRPLDSRGILEVSQRFEIASNYERRDGSRPAGIRLGTGSYEMSVTANFIKEEPAPRLFFYTPNSKYEEPKDKSLLIHFSVNNKGKEKNYQTADVNIPLTGKVRTAIYGSEIGQGFDLYLSENPVTSKSPPRTTVQECQVVDTCYSGSRYGRYYGGYGDYGDGCSYAQGTQTVVQHDDISTNYVKIKFAIGKKIIGSYTGKEETKDTVTDSEGKCRLNVPR